jgi:hypothetical protein
MDALLLYRTSSDSESESGELPPRKRIRRKDVTEDTASSNEDVALGKGAFEPTIVDGPRSEPTGRGISACLQSEQTSAPNYNPDTERHSVSGLTPQTDRPLLRFLPQPDFERGLPPTLQHSLSSRSQLGMPL